MAWTLTLVPAFIECRSRDNLMLRSERSERLEAWATGMMLAPTLRDGPTGLLRVRLCPNQGPGSRASRQRLFVQDLDRERRQHLGLLQRFGRLVDLLHGGRRNDARRAGLRRVIAGDDDIGPEILHHVAGAVGGFRVVLVDRAWLVQTPRPRPVVGAHR